MLLKRFSFCMSLRAGTIMIGTSGLLFTLVFLIIILVANIKLTPVIVPDPSGILTKISVSFEVIVLIIISILLIVGAAKYKRWYLVPWLVVSVITAVGMIVASICSSIAAFQDDNVPSGWFYIVYGLLVTAISIYCWIVVFSFFQELTQEEQGRQGARHGYR